MSGTLSHDAFNITWLDALDITRVQLLSSFLQLFMCLSLQRVAIILWHDDSLIFSTLFAPCMALLTRILNAIHTDAQLNLRAYIVCENIEHHLADFYWSPSKIKSTQN